MKINNLKTLLFVLASIFIVACSDDENDPINAADINLANIETIIASEGNYGSNNSILSVFTRNNKVAKDAFNIVNKGYKLGDTAQSIAIINGKIYITLSGTKEVAVLDKDFKYIKSIKSGDFMGPQYIVQTSSKEAAISDLYNGKIIFIDTETDEVIGSFPLKGNGKQLLAVKNNLYVAEDDRIEVISIADKKLVKTLELPVTSKSKLILDKNGYIWALCCAYEPGWTTIGKVGEAYLAKIDPNNLGSVEKVKIDNSLYPQKLVARLEINKAKDKLYMTLWSDPHFKDEGGWQSVDGGKLGIFSLPTSTTEGLTATSAPMFWVKDYTDPKFKSKAEQLYNIAITKNETIYICDAKDSSQDGALYEYSKEGALINTYALGISPQYILFVNE